MTCSFHPGLEHIRDHRMDQPSMDRQVYFQELMRLQKELIKLQDWVAHTGYKLVVLFEGRDAAGKGGVIKRITQRLNPRICRVGCATGSVRAPAKPVVFSALCVTPSSGRRNGLVRPFLVQPRWRGARHGLLFRAGRAGLLS